MNYVKIILEGTDFEYKCYFKNKECTIFHREDGPAIEYKDGSKEWWIDGKLHREVGPAIEWWDNNKEYYLNHKHYSKEKFELKMQRKRFGYFV